MRKYAPIILFLIFTGCVTQPNLTPSPQPTIIETSVPSSSVTVQPAVTPTSYPSSSNLPTNGPTPAFPSSSNSGPPPPVILTDVTQLDIPETTNYIEPLFAMNQEGNIVFANTKIRMGETTYNPNGEGSTPRYNDAYARTFNKFGIPIINEFKIKDNSKVYDIAIDKVGNIFTLYMGNEGKLNLRKYNINGIPEGDEILISSTSDIFSRDIIYLPKITLNTTGDIFISWVNIKPKLDPFANNIYQPYESIEIIVQKLNSSLNLVSDVHRNIDNLQADPRNIESTIDQAGNYYIAWNEGKNLNVCKFDKNLDLLFFNPNIITTDYNFTNHTIKTGNDNNLIISWNNLKNNENTIYLRKYESNLTTYKESKVNTNKSLPNGVKPFITIDSKDIITISWTSKIAPTLDKPNIFIRKYDNELIPLSKEVFISNIDSDIYIMYVYTDIADNLYLIFGGKKAYLKKYDKNGILFTM